MYSTDKRWKQLGALLVNYSAWDIPACRLSLNQAALGKVSSLRWIKTRWCLVRVPNAALAQQAETDLETITDMFFDACLIVWISTSMGRFMRTGNPCCKMAYS